MTLPLRRRDTSNFNKDWNTCKVGFGDDLFVNPNSYNFFIGLEKLHQLTQQASYRFELYIDYYTNYNYDYNTQQGSAIYHNFTIGPESESYALTFDPFDTVASTIDNGFSSSPPLKFEADGKYLCYKYGGVAAWFGSDCEGYTVFTDGQFRWTVNGPYSTQYIVKMLEFRLVRSSAFYEG
ncbi:ficolin-1-A-like [Littorina saxatilis]|uniref:ficolin-1-A-like n=1 Tax=Littorina saxatilis TaxID=31220 RepID=UPI0038B55A82